MTTHRSTAYVKSLNDRLWHRGTFEPITSQFRFILRMAYACHTQNFPYDLTWTRADGRMAATVTVTGNIPTPRPLPKAPKPKPVATWKPAIWDAEYRLDAYGDPKQPGKKCPGFVIAHSSGLSLVHPSSTGELGVGEYGDEDIRHGWFVIHSASGKGFGLTLNFKRATDALLLAASFKLDWTQAAEVITTQPEFKRAGYTVLAAYSTGGEKDAAKRKLAELEQAVEQAA